MTTQYTELIQLKVTKTMKKMLEEKADKYNVKVSEYLRLLIIENVILKDPDTAEIKLIDSFSDKAS